MLPCCSVPCNSAINHWLQVGAGGSEFSLAFHRCHVMPMPMHKTFGPSWITKTRFSLFALTALCLGPVSGHAQFGLRGSGMGGPPSGPRFDGRMAKLFGDVTAFSAVLEMEAKESSNTPITIPGKLFVKDGQSRFEMDLSRLKGGKMSPQAAAQMKAMGMDRMVMITLPDKKLSYVIYPGLNAYTETPLAETDDGRSNDYKVEITELGKETVDGHPCIKNKVVFTSEKDKPKEATVWNATDLKKFPVKIQHSESDRPVTLLFKDVKLAKPDEGLFEPSSSFTRYESMMSLMQQEMMKRMGGAGFPPPQR